MLLFLGLTVQPVLAQTVVEYLHTDALGSVVAVTDESGNVIERREYEPYGYQLTPAVQDGPGYTGHVQDAATGLTYMQQRYYDPICGCFLSVDPVTAYSNPVGQFHRYRYANNNPYKFTDPDGRQAAERWVEYHRTEVEAGRGAQFDSMEGPAVTATATIVSLTPVIGPYLGLTLRNAEKASSGLLPVPWTPS
ncbi:RHS repeat-associated core domain-containing protein [Pseudoxanthomonas putridarboris]|uniref:RHS repeat-associated core domain-containing protein n=2 Tax=Pseudoxanthomonas putridarboris TaxID=752605 RepID=A0ABU9J0D7_9GAMM